MISFSRSVSYGTEAGLIKIVDELFLNLDKNGVSGLEYYMIDHNLSLLKLEAYGVTDRAYNWCQSYISGRRQLVCIDGKLWSSPKICP